MTTQSQQQTKAGRRRPLGFTLLEMLTVVVIVGLLLAIGVPSILQMQKHAIEKASRVMINNLDGACRSYANDYRQRFPPSNRMPWDTADKTEIGRYCLAQALTGYAPGTTDGVDGWGYRVPPNTQGAGRIQVPLVDINKIRLTASTTTQAVFRDGFENEIWYYCQTDDWYKYSRGEVQTKPTTDPFVKAHNPPDFDPNEYARVKSGERTWYTMDILLCSRGADAIWGSRSHLDGNTKLYSYQYPNVDDITNFLGE